MLPQHPQGPIASPAQEADPIPLQVDAKVTLGLGGVAVVLGAVMAAMGLFAYLSVPSSLVVLQVVPFLVLAVGADNIFIFVLEYQVSGHLPDTLRCSQVVPGCSPQMPRVVPRASLPDAVLIPAEALLWVCHPHTTLPPALTQVPSVGCQVAHGGTR